MSGRLPGLLTHHRRGGGRRVLRRLLGCNDAAGMLLYRPQKDNTRLYNDRRGLDEYEYPLNLLREAELRDRD